ncbi:MAG: F0F1 ATP synthase subunit A [Acidobacteria bacterium]|nr:F0F1 ATP synthase subunit A [Acidobacteriota bacterium]
MSLWLALTQEDPEAAHAASETAVTAAHAAEHGGSEKFDAGHMILEHILDSNQLDFHPFGEIPLPQIHWLGLDLSITRHVAMMWFAAIALITVAVLAARIQKRGAGRLGQVAEMVVLFVRDELAIPNIGHHGAQYVPYLLSTFLFILFCNLLGLVPYGAATTGNISVTAALALMAFFMMQMSGIREYGVVGHFKHLVPAGVPGWMMIIMIPVELIGMVAKPFALCIRLFANMMGGHVVILSLLGLIFIMGSWFVVPISVGFALFINILELLVAFIQAYIFTMLTSLFIGMSVHPH